ncbi:MAG: carbohydrate porin [Pseudolabrys sp.]|nr:carbohydrate porin [Pseudolabrys sp.]
MALGPAAVQAAEQTRPVASIWEQDTLTGDWGGARTALKDSGVDVTLNYIGETHAVLSGGINRRASYEGRLEFSVDTDLEKLIGWKGATTHVTVFQIHNGGRNAADNIGSIFDPSNIDAVPTTRLFTAWFEQSVNDRMSLRIGQLAGDDEFIVSPTAGGLINGTFGWAAILAANMTSGGPAYPLATPGARLKVNAADDLTLLAAVFSGDPAGSDCHDVPQQCNKHGTTFSFTGGSLWMGEAQYAINQGKDAKGLAGVYKLGVWYATADFADQHFGLNSSGAAVSLADPAAVAALDHRGNWGLYGVADQMVWRGEAASLNLFLRGGASPSDRNLLSFYVDGGAGFKGLLPGRANDVLTFGVAYGRISPAAAALDRDIALAAPPYPIRDYELLFELSYQAQLAPWWIVQPDIQYIVHPGGHVPDPNNPAAAVGDAFIAGIRSIVKF